MGKVQPLCENERIKESLRSAHLLEEPLRASPTGRLPFTKPAFTPASSISSLFSLAQTRQVCSSKHVADVFTGALCRNSGIVFLKPKTASVIQQRCE